MTFLIGFILGLLSSGIVGYIIYQKQKQDAIKSNKRLILAIQKQFKPVASTVSEVSKSQEELLNKFNTIKIKFNNAIIDHNVAELLPLAQEYTKIADSIAERNEHKISLSIPENLKLTIHEICKLHKRLFPKEYEFGGNLRKSKVIIAGNNDKYIPPLPSKVPESLKKLINWWNKQMINFQNLDFENKLDILTKFHHQFLSIHPFLDGNGRIARLIFIGQAYGLFNKNIKFNVERSTYYKALSIADEYSLDALKEIFRKLLKV